MKAPSAHTRAGNKQSPHGSVDNFETVCGDRSSPGHAYRMPLLDAPRHVRDAHIRRRRIGKARQNLAIGAFQHDTHETPRMIVQRGIRIIAQDAVQKDIEPAVFGQQTPAQQVGMPRVPDNLIEDSFRLHDGGEVLRRRQKVRR